MFWEMSCGWFWATPFFEVFFLRILNVPGAFIEYFLEVPGASSMQTPQKVICGFIDKVPGASILQNF
jgi:hypothetical protein